MSKIYPRTIQELYTYMFNVPAASITLLTFRGFCIQSCCIHRLSFLTHQVTKLDKAPANNVYVLPTNLHL